MAFKDWLSVSHAAREGARAGATYGDDPTADIQIIRDVERTLAPAGIANGMNVRVFNAEAPGTGENYSLHAGKRLQRQHPGWSPAARWPLPPPVVRPCSSPICAGSHPLDVTDNALLCSAHDPAAPQGLDPDPYAFTAPDGRGPDLLPREDLRRRVLWRR